MATREEAARNRRAARAVNTKIRKAFRESDHDGAKVLMRKFRSENLAQAMGYSSFNSWVQNDCPWSTAVAYRMSKAIPVEPQKQAQDPTVDPAKVIPPSPVLASARTDRLGHLIDETLGDCFAWADKFDEIEELLGCIHLKLNELCGVPAGAELAVHNRAENVRQHLDAVRGIAQRSRPWAECPYCKQSLTRYCEACGGRRWVTASRWDQFKQIDE